MRKKESEWKRQLPGGGPDFEVPSLGFSTITFGSNKIPLLL